MFATRPPNRPIKSPNASEELLADALLIGSLRDVINLAQADAFPQIEVQSRALLACGLHSSFAMDTIKEISNLKMGRPDFGLPKNGNVTVRLVKRNILAGSTAPPTSATWVEESLSHPIQWPFLYFWDVTAPKELFVIQVLRSTDLSARVLDQFRIFSSDDIINHERLQLVRVANGPHSGKVIRLMMKVQEGERLDYLICFQRPHFLTRVLLIRYGSRGHECRLRLAIPEGTFHGAR